MRLVTGPAGSGKTAVLVGEFREALRAGGEGVRLLAPTAAMAQHLQNQLAREGLVFHRGLIQTLSAFVDERASDVRQAPTAVLCLLVEQAARRLQRPEFARVVDTAGFCAALARTIEEFASAGCDSTRLAACLPDTLLGGAFLEVYAEVDRELAHRGMELRGRRLERVAARIERDGTGGIRAVWLDGFHALPDPELRVIGALGRHAEVTLAIAEDDLPPPLRKQLAGMGFREEHLARKRAAAAVTIVKAAGIEREAEEIARRILEQAASGRTWREMGIIVRTPDAYVPVLRSTLERFGIPSWFCFDERLDCHAAVRYLSGAVEAMLGGWDHRETLKVLRLAPRFADLNAMDRFDFAVRRQIPNAGLGALKALTENSEPLLRRIEALGEIEEWRAFALEPKDWAARLRMLRNQFRPSRPEPNARRAAIWRSQAAALDAFDQALDEAAMALEARSSLALEDFWRAVKAVLRLKPLRLEESARNVVHVLSAHEARQWALAEVWVCGMVEKQFPQLHPQNAFFPETAREQLNAAGIRVRTAAEFEREERALFDSAINRTTSQVTLSYPKFSPHGEPNQPSLFLEEWTATVEMRTARAVKPRPYAGPGPGGGTREGIRAPALVEILRKKTEVVSPACLETYRQCPFQYFGKYVLKLNARPVRPEQRLDLLTQGAVVHAVLARFYRERRNLDDLFEEVFAEQAEENVIPPGYRREAAYRAMLEDLRALVNSPELPRGNAESQTEEQFEYELEAGVRVRGKIDRLDVDWKSGELPEGWRDAAVRQTMGIVKAIRDGRMEVAPADRDKCKWCEMRDVCRVGSENVAVAEQDD